MDVPGKLVFSVVLALATWFRQTDDALWSGKELFLWN